jgi:hypothetical protein
MANDIVEFLKTLGVGRVALVGQASVVDKRPDKFGGGVAPYALDPKNAERLWSLATAMLAP